CPEFGTPGEAAYYVVMNPNYQFGLNGIRVKLQHALVVMASAQSVAQRGKPRTLDQAGVSGELSASNSAGVKRAYIFRIRLEQVLLKVECALHQILDLFLYCRISRPVRHVDEAVVGVFRGVQRAHPIQLVKQNRGEEVVYREGVIWMALQNLLKFVNSPVVVKVVEMIESRLVERIVRP